MATRAKSNSRSKTTSRKQLRATYQRFMAKSNQAAKNKAGEDLIRAIFGKDAIAGQP